MYISPETVATIEKHESGSFTLTLYDNKKIIFSGNYVTFRAACIAQTKRLNNYYFKGEMKK